MNTLSTNQKRATVSSAKGLAAFGLLAGVAADAIRPAAFDWQDWTAKLFELLLPALTVVVVYFTRVLIDQYIPPMVLPAVGPLVAIFAEWLQSLATGETNFILAGILGIAAALAYAAARESVGETP